MEPGGEGGGGGGQTSISLTEMLVKEQISSSRKNGLAPNEMQQQKNHIQKWPLRIRFLVNLNCFTNISDH